MAAAALQSKVNALCKMPEDRAIREYAKLKAQYEPAKAGPSLFDVMEES